MKSITRMAGSSNKTLSSLLGISGYMSFMSKKHGHKEKIKAFI